MRIWSYTHIIIWLMIRSSQEKDNRTGKNDQETIQIISEQSAAKMRREDTAIYSPALVIIGYDAVYAWRRRDMRYYLDYGVAESDAMQIKNNVIAEGRGAGLLMSPIEISDSEAVRKALELPESFHVAAILEVGYPLQEKDDRIGAYAVAG